MSTDTETDSEFNLRSYSGGRYSGSRWSRGKDFSPHPNVMKRNLIDLARDLLALGNVPQTDLRVVSIMDQMSTQYNQLCKRDKEHINKQLAEICSGTRDNIRPGTAASFACGCFLNGNDGCTVLCAGSLNTPGCEDTILHWTRENGTIVSKVLSQGSNGICKVYVDPGITVGSDKSMSLLSQGGCSTANFFSSMTETSINRASVVGVTPQNTVSNETMAAAQRAAQESRRVTGGLGYGSIFLIIFVVLVVVLLAAWAWRRSKIQQIQVNPIPPV